MTQELPTKKQQQLLAYVEDFIHANKYGPSYREIAKALEYKSVSTVASHIDTLIKKGYLAKGDSYSARSIVLAGGQTPNSDEVTTLTYLRQRQAEFRASGNEQAVNTLQKAIALLDQSDDKQV